MNGAATHGERVAPDDAGAVDDDHVGPQLAQRLAAGVRVHRADRCKRQPPGRGAGRGHACRRSPRGGPRCAARSASGRRRRRPGPEPRASRPAERGGAMISIFGSGVSSSTEIVPKWSMRALTRMCAREPPAMSTAMRGGGAGPPEGAEWGGCVDKGCRLTKQTSSRTQARSGPRRSCHFRTSRRRAVDRASGGSRPPRRASWWQRRCRCRRASA